MQRAVVRYTNANNTTKNGGSVDGQLQLALTTLTVAEVLTGPLRAKQTTLAKRYEKALNRYQVVPLSAAIASLAA